MDTEETKEFFINAEMKRTKLTKEIKEIDKEIKEIEKVMEDIKALFPAVETWSNKTYDTSRFAYDGRSYNQETNTPKPTIKFTVKKHGLDKYGEKQTQEVNSLKAEGKRLDKKIKYLKEGKI